MRMWNVNPKLMCRQHLLGEHLEMHMFAGTIKKGIKIDGYIKNGLVQIGDIKNRHDILALEMFMRGYKHKSLMLPFNEGHKTYPKINIKANIIELKRRCNECKERLQKA